MGFPAGRGFLTMRGLTLRGSPVCLRMPVLAELPDVDSVASNAAAEVLVISGADAELLDVAFGPDSVSQVSSGQVGAPSSISQVSSSGSSTAGAAPMARSTDGFRPARASRQLYAMSVWMAVSAAILRSFALDDAWLAMAWEIWAKV